MKNLHFMKQLFALGLALIMVLGTLCLVACKDTPDTPPDQTPGTDPGTDPDTTPGTTPETPPDEGKTDDEDTRLSIDYLPTQPYGTKDAPVSYHILQYSANGQTEVGSGWITWEEGDVDIMDGDRLNEAVFTRNAAVEENYGIEISASYAQVDIQPTWTYRVSTNASSGDDEYQLITARTLEMTSAMLEGYCLDLNDYDQYIHTDMPWWVKDSVDSFTLGEHLYAACSEILLRDKGATAAIYFNEDLAEDAGADNLYDMVREYQWTLEELVEVCELVSRDRDGSQLIDSTEDVWGMYGGDDIVYYLYNAMGHKFAHINEEGYLENEFGEDDDSITDLQDIFTEVMYSDWYMNIMTKGASVNPENKNLFHNGAALMQADMIKFVPKNVDFNYGILPYPLLDEDQESYSSLVWMHWDCTLAIPAAVGDKDFAAVILEALSYESYYTVSPVFYEAILLNRAAKNADSKQMLEWILDSRSYDPGQYWQGTNDLHGNAGILRLSAKGTSDIAGLWAKYEDIVRKNFQKINNIIDGKEG